MINLDDDVAELRGRQAVDRRSSIFPPAEPAASFPLSGVSAILAGLNEVSVPLNSHELAKAFEAPDLRSRHASTPSTRRVQRMTTAIETTATTSDVRPRSRRSRPSVFARGPGGSPEFLL